MCSWEPKASQSWELREAKKDGQGVGREEKGRLSTQGRDPGRALRGHPPGAFKGRRETSLANVSRVEVSGVEAMEGLAEESELDPETGQGHRNEMKGISCLGKVLDVLSFL